MPKKSRKRREAEKRARERVTEAAGAPDQVRGTETFWPPAPGMTYLRGILPRSWKALDESFILSPPELLVAATARKAAARHHKKGLGMPSPRVFADSF